MGTLTETVLKIVSKVVKKKQTTDNYNLSNIKIERDAMF